MTISPPSTLVQEMSSMDSEKKYITIEELEKHNKPDDLWISVQGKVYNVTQWSKVHPGGEVALLNMGGQDVTDAFIAFHPSTIWRRLETFFNGYYIKDYKVSDVSKDYRKLASELVKAGMFENKAALLGFSWIQVAYLGHDSGHYQAMTTQGWNKMAGILIGNCITGISIAWWKWTHNAHHIACNSLDYDPDLQHLPMLAVSDTFFWSITSKFYERKLTFDRVAKFFISYQHLTYYPVMCVARVNLYLQTLLLLCSKRKIADRGLNILGTLIFWTWFPLLVSCLPNWTERVMFVLVSFCVCAIQHVQFTLNHFAGDTYLGPPKGTNWFEKQSGGTINISCYPWMDWFYGGLQFQLEHHLFPRLPRAQLRSISPLVKELCKKHNMPYRSLSFYEANVTTLKTLKSAALQARGLLWEAVNTHG
ncbi:delta(8)-fatty-acid desaturase-like isoform X2 [Apium graveolens]|uniref:delta(8)-fatty-acid desaturase-like isoform X2 n=1 Tax=Apium graveolens TaxID=4045 RepID=UPI003D7ABFC4